MIIDAEVNKWQIEVESSTANGKVSIEETLNVSHFYKKDRYF